MAHDPTRIFDLTMRLVRAVRHDIAVNGWRGALEADDIKAGDRTTKAVKGLALELLEEQLTDRDRTEEFHRQISKYVPLPPPHKPHTPRRTTHAVKHAAKTL